MTYAIQMPRLETDLDQQLELRAIERLREWYDYQFTKLPELSPMDYLMSNDVEVVAGIEIKTRKETPEQIKEYGKLILKWRKYQELNAIGQLLHIPTYVLFAFENSEGQLSLLNIQALEKTNPKPADPPIRRNYRGLACDEEPVIYFDWHLLTIVREPHA